MKEKNEIGSSLLEVIIAIMILGLAGTVLVAGLFISRVASEKTATKRDAIAQLAEISQELTAMPFMPCSPPLNDVYPTPAPTNYPQLNDVTLKVEVLEAVTNKWITCSVDSQTSTKGIQKVTITTKANGLSFSQVVVKTRG